MRILGESFIGFTPIRGTADAVAPLAAVTGDAVQPSFGGNTLEDLERACSLADGCFNTFRALPGAQRADWLEAIAEGILDLGEALIERAHLETGLPKTRLRGECQRTVKQLRMFAELLRDGDWDGAVIEQGVEGGRPDLRLRRIGVGPVAVFGASNFPLAFSVAGGDTAAALAAGCPVIVKAHPAHLGTSELVARAVIGAAKKTEMPDGVFSMVVDPGITLGQALVGHPLIQAVGFTGSRHVGLALVRIAQSRPVPIPVYAEMSSINPVFLLPAILERSAPELAERFVSSLALGSGQFCTNPGLLIAIEGEDLERFEAAVVNALAISKPATMLTPGIHSSYSLGLAALRTSGAAVLVGESPVPTETYEPQAALFAISAAAFLVAPELHAENFGPSGVLVRCKDMGEMLKIVSSLDGQLTATIHADEGDFHIAEKLMPLLERLAGRILFNGFPTGVEVSKAMVHGGPFPSTSDSRTSSVGTVAIERFLRPICYQDVPAALLPPSLKSQQ